MTKQDQLGKLKQEVEENKELPLRKGATQLVFGEGNPEARIYFLGEAPGYWEDQKGRPFVGQAGKLLDKALEEIGISRSDVYISNVVRFRPPGNRDPYPEELEAFAPYVDQEIEIIDPKVIVTLGRFSMGKFLPDVKISKVHGKVFEIDWQGEKRIVMPMFHPAAALRRVEIMKQFYLDFEKLKKVSDKILVQKDEQLNLI
ncbi:uracil-DNA glycosylase [Candidatus Daviesbacteria bacterium]|nr:uracil-DNA glycosylase [Candidatus Daviesbacteria bacterium]